MRLAERVLQGEIRAASRLMRWAEEGLPQATPELRQLFPHTGRARVIGITGSPGAGKSTLTDRLIAQFRSRGQRVGVLAVDPTSPFTGGAILGDRIRMQAHATDSEVFIRSLATRGHLGGLSRATGDCIRIMDALGKDVVLVETVGVGQDEIEIAQLAHTTVVVLVPGMGDDVQAIKAGILEVADLFVVNKADLAGVDRTLRDLRMMLELRHAIAPHTASPSVAWEPTIHPLIASKNTGVDALMDGLDKHHAHLVQSGELEKRNQTRAATELLGMLKHRLLHAAIERLERQKGRLDEVAGRIAKREADPYALVDELAASLGA
ncbi:MAG: methylmalonyl Co-A mutase-associated GTPase MeaB [Myxococcaceae bacterium]